MGAQARALQDVAAPYSAGPIDVLDFVINIGLSALLGYLLSQIYIRCGTSLSNRRQFAGNFMLLAMTTMLIITVVKSSLALSLGLVGALSIVRFRAAIKEPEELAYLFLTIAVGLGLGADQRWITLSAFTGIIAIILLRSMIRETIDQHDYCLTVTSMGASRAKLSDVVAVLQKHSRALDLKRYDDGVEALEASFMVEFENLDALESSKEALRQKDPDLAISFLDSKGIL